MKSLFKGSRIAYEDGKIYVQGNYLEYYNENDDCLEGDCPLVFVNLDMIQIDEDGLWLEQKGRDSLEQDNTWKLYEINHTGEKYHYLDNDILKEELKKCIEF